MDMTTRIKEQKEREAKVCAAVDMMIETVTEGETKDEEGCGLCEAVLVLVPHLDKINCDIVKDLADERIEELSTLDDEGENYTPSTQELKEAADARGESGPLDKEAAWKSKIIKQAVSVEAIEKPHNEDETLVEEILTTVILPNGDTRPVDTGDAVELASRLCEDMDWIACNQLLAHLNPRMEVLNLEVDLYEKAQDIKEPEGDADYFEIAKGIRHKAILFNMAVLEARQYHGIITKIESTGEEGCVMVKDIRCIMEMPL